MSRGGRVSKCLPIAKGQVADYPKIRAVAEAQVALAWVPAQGDTLIPVAGDPVYMAENWASQGLQVTAYDLTPIATTHQKTRSIASEGGPDWDLPQD